MSHTRLREVAERRPTLWSAQRMRRLLNLYPPYFLQRIVVVDVAEDFCRVRVRLQRSLLTRNLNGTAFGGSIYAAADPIYALMYWQALARRGLALQTWLMASRVQYRKPAAAALTFDFELTASDLDAAQAELQQRGKSVRTHRVEARDPHGQVCAELELVNYLRLLRAGDREISGF